MIAAFYSLSIFYKNLIEQISPETSHHEATNITKNKQEVIHIEEDNSYLSFVNPFY